MKIMFYSQHVLGIGHFFRSMEIASALHRHDVLFVEGGEPLDGFVPPPHVRREFLPPLMMDAEFKAVHSAEGDPEAVKTKRKNLLFSIYREFAPEVLITELFPFGRKQFRFELLPVLDAILSEKPKTKVVCSLRDILVEKNDASSYEDGVTKLLNRYYDLLLVHSDQRVARLDETFGSIGRTNIPIRYTGFVVRKAASDRRASGGKVIVASNGGGKVGVELLAAAIKAVQSLSSDDLELRVFAGPFMEEADRKALIELASRDRRTSLYSFSPDFPGELAAAELSISMAGYNTCMDIIASGVRAIVCPFSQNREQRMRAEKLESLGVLKVLHAPDAEALAAAVEAALTSAPSNARPSIDTAGASKTAAFIEAL